MSKDLFFNAREKEAIFDDVTEAVTNPFYKIQDKIVKAHSEVESGFRNAFDGLIELESYRKQLNDTLA